MRYLYVFVCFIFLSSCAVKNDSSFLQHESTRIDTVAEHAETDNNIEKYKYQLEDKLFVISKNIMEDEAEIAKALSYKRMLRYIGYIKKELDKSLEIIDEYNEKSDNAEYRKHIEYVKCTYIVTKSSYMYMESVIKSEQENQYIKYLDKFREKLRNDTATVFLKDMEKCEKIRNIYTKNK